MIRQRLINCDFLNASTFINGLGNKAKLLYLLMITNADDLGFVSNVHTIIDTLTSKDDESHQVNLELLKNDYTSALVELINKTYVYRFADKYGNEIYVIKHWFMHNKHSDNLRTNYYKFYKQLELYMGEYHLKEKKEKPLKENKINESKENQNKLDNSNDEWNELINEAEELNGMSLEEINEIEEREENDNE